MSGTVTALGPAVQLVSGTSAVFRRWQHGRIGTWVDAMFRSANA